MQKQVRREITNFEKDKVILDYNNGVNIADIAKDLNREWNTIKGILKREDLYKITVPRISEEVKHKILKLYTQNKLSARQICKELKISKFSVIETLRDFDVEIETGRNQRKYNFNEDYFEIIDSEDKAYFLGFLYADGYNDQKEGKVTLNLAAQDLEIIESFNNFLDSDKIIYSRTGACKNCQDSKILSLNSRKFSDDLAKLGCVQAKTFEIKFPDTSIVPEHLQKHFIRGYFDGDGYVSKKESRVEIVGTLKFCEELVEVFYRNLKINPSKIRDRHPERNNNIRILIYYGLNKIYALYPYLYDEATIYLDRKKDKFFKLYNNIKARKTNGK